MKYKIITLLIFLSSASFAYAGTWSAPINHPGIPPPNQFCDQPPLYPTSQMPTGSACSPDGSTYTFGSMSMCDLGGGEFSTYQNANNVQQQTCNPSGNTPPTANAGIDRTITQPTSSATPSGASASDPGGSVASTVWSFVSGPGSTPTISNSTTLTPTFNGMATAGVYTFRLRVTDNLGLFTDDTMTVTVNVATPQCNDGIDNDGDTRIDIGDWGCHSDNNATNAASYVSTDNDESNPYCNVPGWGAEELVYDGDLSGPGGVGWCNSTSYGACPSNLGGGPTSVSAKGSAAACCRGQDYLGWIRQCTGSPPAPIDGACGSEAGNTLPAEPTGGPSACASGTFNASTPADTSTNWNWTCNGINGGSSVQCTATKSSGGAPPACPYGIQSTQTTSAKAFDAPDTYPDNMWGNWSPVCGTSWDAPFMNDAAIFARNAGVPESPDVDAMEVAFGWFPQPGAPEEYDTTTGNTTRLSWVFDQWQGSQADLIPCVGQITVNVCNAPPNYTLTTAVSPGGSGTVSATGISCPGDCTESYVVNTMVTVVATPAVGYAFSSWSGACAGQPSSCSLQMDGNKNTTANFVLSPTFDYSISNSGTSNVTKTAGDAYTTNTITRTLTSGTTEAVTITATGMPSGVSVSYDGNRTCSPNPSCVSTITFTVNSSTAAGTYNITVTSAGDGTPGPRSTNFNLVVTQPSGLSVSCSANPTSAMIGDNITWTATPSGGTSPYTYSWSGTDIPTSPAPTTNPYIKKYETIGTKTATVTVTDAGSFQATCNPAAVTQINFDPSFEEF